MIRLLWMTLLLNTTLITTGCSMEGSGSGSKNLPSPDRSPDPDPTQNPDLGGGKKKKYPLHLSSGMIPPSSLSKELSDSWLKFSCEQVGGDYIQERHLCLCPPGSFFRFWVDRETAEPNAVCEEVLVKSKVDSFGNDYFRLESKSKKIKSDLALDHQTDFSSSFFSFPSTLDKVFATSFLNLKGVKNLIQEDSTNDFYLVTMMEDIKKYLTLFIEKRPEKADFPHVGDNGLDLSVQFLLESDSERLIETLSGLRRQLKPALLKINKTLVAQNQTLGIALKEVMEIIQQEIPEEIYTTHSQYGCAEYCQFDREWSLIHASPLKLRWEKSYLSGAVYENRAFISDSTDKILAQLLLTPIDDISLLVFYDYQDQKILNKLTNVRKASFFDRDGSSIFENEQKLIHSQGIRKKSILNIDPLNPLSKLVVCESGFPRNLDNGEQGGVFDRLLFGDKEKDSFFGWMNNPTHSVIPFFSGINQSFFSPGRQFLYPNPFHAETVSQVALNHQEARLDFVIPIGTYDCVHATPLFEKNVLDVKARVLNFSHLFVFDNQACELTPLVQNIRASRLLWVGGSGNGGEKVTQAQSYGCPTNIGPLPNLIIAVPGYTDQGPIAQEATYGEEVSDLVAYGKGPLLNSPFAASYAAPRVSAVAARLATDFEELSIEKIRLALLLGSFIPIHWMDSNKNDFMDVRSGGGLDDGLARKACEYFLKYPNPFGSEEEQKKQELDLLYSVHCSDLAKKNRLSCRERIQERHERLVRTGILKSNLP